MLSPCLKFTPGRISHCEEEQTGRGKLMSLRKPKSVIIKHDESDSSGGGEDHNETISSSVRQVKGELDGFMGCVLSTNRG